MKHQRKRLAVSAAIALIACLGAAAYGRIGTPAQSGPAYSYRLDVEAAPGGKPTVQLGGGTTFTYRRMAPDGTSTVLWKQTMYEEYAQHWISPTGRVWILFGGETGITTAPPSATLLVADPTHRSLAYWRMPELGRDGWKPTRDAVSGRLTELKPGSVEELGLKLKDGRELKTVVVFDPDGKVSYGIQQWAAEPPTALYRVLSDPGYEVPTFDESTRSPWLFSLWHATALAGQAKDRYWVQYGFYHTEIQGPQIMRIENWREVPREADGMFWMWGGHCLWFEEPRAEGDKMLMRVLSTRGEEERQIDLADLGGFPSAQEAARSIDWRHMSALENGQWQPVQVGKGTAWWRLDMFDSKRQRYVITADGKTGVHVHMTHGPAARRSPDEGFAGTEPAPDKSYRSPNGAYRLRCRWYADPRFPSSRMDFYGKAEKDGETAEVILWSTAYYVAPDAAYVSDGGTSYVFQFTGGSFEAADAASRAAGDCATLDVRDASGNSVTRLDLVAPEGFHSSKEAYSNILIKDFPIRTSGETTQKIDDLVLPGVKQESFVLKFRDGRKRVYRVFGGPAGHAVTCDSR